MNCVAKYAISLIFCLIAQTGCAMEKKNGEASNKTTPEASAQKQVSTEKPLAVKAASVILYYDTPCGFSRVYVMTAIPASSQTDGCATPCDCP